MSRLADVLNVGSTGPAAAASAIGVRARCCGRSPARRWPSDLPSPVQDLGGEQAVHRSSRSTKRGELDQGILRFTWYSLVLVAKGYALALLIGTPLGFLLGLSKTFTKSFDPIIQILRPVSPLAWLPLGLVLFQKSRAGGAVHHRHLLDVADGAEHRGRRARDPAGLPERRPGAEAVAARRRFFKILLPATLPYMFTGFRLSLGIAWLVIVAAEMLTGAPGVGGFLWQEYNSLIYEHIILCILTIGLVGFVLDRLMSVVETRASRRLRRCRHGFPRTEERQQGLSAPAAAPRCCATSTSQSRGRVRRHRRLLRRRQDHADLADRRPAHARRRHGHARRARRSPGPGRSAASCSRTTRCCRG